MADEGKVIVLATGNIVYVLRADQGDIVAHYRAVHDVAYPADDGPMVKTMTPERWTEVEAGLRALPEPPTIEDLRGPRE